VFIPVKTLLPYLSFVGKDRSLPERFFNRDKHSSLLQTFANYSHKMFYNIDNRKPNLGGWRELRTFKIKKPWLKLSKRPKILTLTLLRTTGKRKEAGRGSSLQKWADGQNSEAEMIEKTKIQI
jgi:hypothetical protein